MVSIGEFGGNRHVPRLPMGGTTTGVSLEQGLGLISVVLLIALKPTCNCKRHLLLALVAPQFNLVFNLNAPFTKIEEEEENGAIWLSPSSCPFKCVWLLLNDPPHGYVDAVWPSIVLFSFFCALHTAAPLLMRIVK